MSDLLVDAVYSDQTPDPRTAWWLLPNAFVRRDNSRKMNHYKIALRQGMRRCLTPAQRNQLDWYYREGLRKSEIARKQNTTCSAVSKSIRAGEQSLREYIETYMNIFEIVESDFLREEAW